MRWVDFGAQCYVHPSVVPGVGELSAAMCLALALLTVARAPPRWRLVWLLVGAGSGLIIVIWQRMGGSKPVVYGTTGTLVVLLNGVNRVCGKCRS